jgi:hypothetical protein
MPYVTTRPCLPLSFFGNFFASHLISLGQKSA